MRFLLAFLLAVAACAQAETAIKFSIAGGKSTTTVPFEVIDNRVFIPVRINGQGPFRFILDTGAAEFSISPGTAAKLGVKVKAGQDMAGVGESAVHTGEAHIAKAEIGGLRFENVEASVVPIPDFASVFGKLSFDGVVGQEVFDRVVAKHDYVAKVLTFTLPDRYRYTGTGSIVHFDLADEIPAPLIDAELDGVRAKFAIDTGARSSLLLYSPFVAQNKLVEKYQAKLEGVTGWGLGGPVRSLLARAGELRMADAQVHDIVIRLSTQKAGLTTSSALAGLIGPDVLSQFDVTFDYVRRRMILEKNLNYGRRDSYDRAGVWMGQDGEHFKAVDVIAGGPAAEAGVVTGDIILAIDGASTDTLVLPDVREKIRRGAVGSKLTLLLESSGKQRTAVITLRDMV